MKKYLLLTILLTTIGCQNIYIDSIIAYNRDSARIALGQSKNSVLNTLRASSELVPIYSRKSPDIFTKDGNSIEIHYFYTTWQDDGITTDDEFTPYIFKNDKLVAIGWHTIGGVKTQAKPKTQIDINNYNYGGAYRDW